MPRKPWKLRLMRLSQFDPDVVWFYYLSAHNFVYLAPRVSLAQFHFSPALYAQRYWSRARPEQDPEKQFILVGPYRDLALAAARY